MIRRAATIHVPLQLTLEIRNRALKYTQLTAQEVELAIPKSHEAAAVSGLLHVLENGISALFDILSLARRVVRAQLRVVPVPACLTRAGKIASM
jgi:hypothetical protein